MFSSLSLYFTAVMGVLMAGLALSALAFSVRRRRMYERLTSKKTFHCLRCDTVYTSDGGSQSANCPKCNYKNGRLKF